MKRRAIVLALAGATLAAAPAAVLVPLGGCSRDKDKAAKAKSGQRATREDLVIVARAAGELRAAHSVDLVAPPASGRLRIARLAPDGVPVPAGMPVVSFDPEDVAKDLRDKESDLGTAKSELEQSVLEARSELERLKVEVERTGIELEKARIRAGRDADISSENDRKKARADAVSLETALGEKTRARDLARTRHEKKRRSLEARIEKAEGDVKVAQALLKSYTLAAPVAGTVLLSETWGGGSMRRFQTGDSAWSGQVVASLPDLSTMETVLYVAEADIEAVTVGQSAKITLDAAPDKVFAGKVKSIPILAETLSWDDPNKIFKVVASLDKTDPELMRPGLRLQAEVEIERHKNVITVPLESVAETAGKTKVMLASGDTVEVGLGPRNDDRVVVRSGLEEGTLLRAPGGES